MSIEVLEPGVLTSVQDPLGRRGWRHLGVPVGGAADPWSARLANRLVGNPDGAALLECTVEGPVLEFAGPVTIVLVGDMRAVLDGLPLAPGAARRTRPGSVLRLGPGPDARAWLAVAGGIAVEPVLGSASTDLRAGFGGHQGRALRRGDRLEVGARHGPAGRRPGAVDDARDAPIAIVPGPHATDAVVGALIGVSWHVGIDADRIGVRLDGPSLRGLSPEVASMGLPLGAIQVPPDGRPIVMLADRPVTGGYPVPAVVIGADVGRVARLRPGDPLRFASVSNEEAVARLGARERALELVEPIPIAEDDELGWTGAHE